MTPIEDIRAWLEAVGLGRFADLFEANEIDAEAVIELTDDHVKELGIPLGPRGKLLKAIAKLRIYERGEQQSSVASQPPAATPIERRVEAERRQLTVMFVDLVGSTELAGRLDPEDMGQVIRAYQSCCTEVVEGWGGHVAKYIGDGVLVYFGWPRTHEDEAERAVRAGRAITEAVAGLATPADAPLAARVGIATGLVMVGELIGDGGAQEEAVVGETQNLAARLQALADAGSVVISQATSRLVGGLFELADLGPQRFKGFADPIWAWRVVRTSTAKSRFKAMHTAGLTPLVGREHELGILRERWAWAKDGDGQVVADRGRAGDRQVTAGPRAARAHGRRAVHAAQLLLLALPHQQRALPRDRPLGTGGADRPQ
jgi:class 3 adenylate cyclase